LGGVLSTKNKRGGICGSKNAIFVVQPAPFNMKALKLVFILMILCKAATAQFNDSTQHYINYTSTGSINKGNGVNTYLLNNMLKYQEHQKSLVLNFVNNWVYGRSNSTLTNNDFSSTLDFDLHKTLPHFYYWGLANYNTSISLHINSQILAGLGAAYSIIDQKTEFLNLSDGPVYDASDLYLTYLPNSPRYEHKTVRNSFRLMFKFTIKKVFEVDGADYLQNSFADVHDYIFRTTTNMSLKVNKWLAFTTSLNYNKLTRTHSENLLFTYGLTLEKYF